jgi:hypothetical protein
MAWRPFRLSIGTKLLIVMVGRRTIPAIDDSVIALKSQSRKKNRAGSPAGLVSSGVTPPLALAAPQIDEQIEFDGK